MTTRLLRDEVRPWLSKCQGYKMNNSQSRLTNFAQNYFVI